MMSIDRPEQRAWTVGEKARIVAEAEDLQGESLTAFLQRILLSGGGVTFGRVSVPYEGGRHHRYERMVA
jgi:hypothetical protein